MTSNTQSAPVLSLMIGTAGHVDHGKTSLVKRLTGVNTDRLKEEQARGMSIDFGVAPFVLSDGRRVGIIDVPGHEDFIRNMVSGASSIDLLMLVIAADDSVMPQTVEHLQILHSLGLTQVLVVISKIDLVEEDMLGLVKEDIASFMTRAGYAEAPIVCVSNETGQGIEELKSVLSQLIDKAKRPPDQRAFRMYVRDVFSIKGYGTIATGVPSSGSIGVGENLELLPPNKLSSVRAIQVYKSPAQATIAHLSSAINLRDLQPEEFSRGMALCAPGIYRPVSSALLCVRNNSQSKTLKTKAEMRFHSGTASVAGMIRLLESTELYPGQEAYAVVRFQEKIVLCAGDRFVLRVPSPSDTIGGGIVLSVSHGRLFRKFGNLAGLLREAQLLAEHGDFLGSELLLHASPVVKDKDLSLLASADKITAKQFMEEKEQQGDAIELADGNWLITRRSGEIIARLKKLLARYHRENKFVWGMKPALVTELLDLPASAFSKLCQILLTDSELCLKHGSLALKSFTPQISEREINLRDAILERVKKAGAASVAKGDLLLELEMSASEFKLLSRLLIDQGLLRAIGSNYLLSSLVEECREKLLKLFQEQQVVEIAPFREATGLTRNVAVLILEHFDSEGMTKRQGNGRVLLRRNPT